MIKRQRPSDGAQFAIGLFSSMGSLMIRIGSMAYDSGEIGYEVICRRDRLICIDMAY
jgi:hypothetical protein